jgi:hypothetical protein
MNRWLADAPGDSLLKARIQALLKLGIIASLAFAMCGVTYYRAIEAPRHDAERETARALAVTQAYAQKRAAQIRLAAQRREAEEHRAADQAAAESRYQGCLTSAGTTHDSSWAAACKQIADKAAEDRAGCLAKPNMPQGYCAAVYRARDASPNCTLSVAIAADLDGGMTLARNRCRRERDAALR